MPDTSAELTRGPHHPHPSRWGLLFRLLPRDRSILGRFLTQRFHGVLFNRPRHSSWANPLIHGREAWATLHHRVKPQQSSKSLCAARSEEPFPRPKPLQSCQTKSSAPPRCSRPHQRAHLQLGSPSATRWNVQNMEKYFGSTRNFLCHAQKSRPNLYYFYLMRHTPRLTSCQTLIFLQDM